MASGSLAVLALAAGAALGAERLQQPERAGAWPSRPASTCTAPWPTTCVSVARRARPPAAAAQLQKKADQELRAALPLAAAANSDDGSWNSLMTTISEGATVDEGHLRPLAAGPVRRRRRQPQRQPAVARPGTRTPHART